MLSEATWIHRAAAVFQGADTPLYIVGGADLMSVTYSFVTGASTGGAYAPAYVLCGLIFFVVCFPLSTLATRWEASLKNRKGRVNPAVKTTNKNVELKEAA